VEISPAWLTELLHREGFRWKRTRDTLRHKADPVLQQAARAKLEDLRPCGWRRTGVSDLYFLVAPTMPTGSARCRWGGWFQVFEQAVAAHVEKTAAVCGEHSLGYRELAERVGGLATRLAELGAGPGTVIGLGAGRDLDFLTAAMAVMPRSGGCATPRRRGPRGC
jgi:hypothetical protein